MAYTYQFGTGCFLGAVLTGDDADVCGGLAFAVSEAELPNYDAREKVCNVKY